MLVPKSPLLRADNLIELVFTRGIYGVVPAQTFFAQKNTFTGAGAKRRCGTKQCSVPQQIMWLENSVAAVIVAVDSDPIGLTVGPDGVAKAGDVRVAHHVGVVSTAGGPGVERALD